MHIDCCLDRISPIAGIPLCAQMSRTAHHPILASSPRVHRVKQCICRQASANKQALHNSQEIVAQTENARSSYNFPFRDAGPEDVQHDPRPRRSATPNPPLREKVFRRLFHRQYCKYCFPLSGTDLQDRARRKRIPDRWPLRQNPLT